MSNIQTQLGRVANVPGYAGYIGGGNGSGASEPSDEMRHLRLQIQMLQQQQVTAGTGAGAARGAEGNLTGIKGGGAEREGVAQQSALTPSTKPAAPLNNLFRTF